jgi:hypothetical protein
MPDMLESFILVVPLIYLLFYVIAWLYTRRKYP